MSGLNIARNNPPRRQLLQLHAIRHDSPLRWRIESRTRPEIQHVVDLGAYGGIGKCTCEHFHFRIEPELRAGRRRTAASRCVHIRVARDALADLIIQKMTQPTANQDDNDPAP